MKISYDELVKSHKTVSLLTKRVSCRGVDLRLFTRQLNLRLGDLFLEGIKTVN